MNESTPRAALKKAGLKVTLPRVKILALLHDAESRHWSAEDIFRQLRQQGHDVALATVYRVLTQFEQTGLVSRLRFENGQAMFELNQGEHHDHLVCVRCGCVEEFVDEVIEQRQTHIARQAGFQMQDHVHHIYGLCPACLQLDATSG